MMETYISLILIIVIFALLLFIISKLNNKHVLFISWSVLALILTFPVTYILKGSYPILTFIWISVPLLYTIKVKNIEKIAIKAISTKNFIKYSIINLLIVLAVFALFEPWSHTYKSLIDLVMSSTIKPDTTFAWLIRYKKLPAMVGMYFYSGLITMFGEEIFFRGFLLNLLRYKIGYLKAIIIQSVLFSLFCSAIMFAFMPFEQGLIFTAIYGMSIGIAGGWTVLRTQSILPSLFTAATSNIILVFLWR